MKNFIHLHTHSHYSLLDAAVTVKSLVDKAVEYNMPALAITDHGNLFGAIEFYKEAKKKGIKAIIGCELYISLRSHDEKKVVKGEKRNHHLVVLCRNKEGYQNLLKLASIAYTEGFYYKPRVDKETLRKYSNGLIGLTACLGGEVPNSIINGNEEKAVQAILEYQDIFGKEYFFLELQNHGIDKQEVANKGILKLSKQLNAPIVATNDVHYLTKEDSEAHDILLCIGSQNKVTDDKRKRYHGNEFYFKNYDEMMDVFSDLPEAVDNTMKIAEMCNLELEFKPSLPEIDIPESYTQESYLRYLCDEGLKKRYTEVTSDIRKRLDYELDIICKMGFASYFLIVWDFILYARNKNIAVGPGRGSAAGSLVAYMLRITDIDPLKYNLIFERFLNPERISMPDIDTDFEDEKRDEVIKYVINKYGQDKVASIITFGALKARGVIRDVGRVLDIPLNEVDRLAKLIPGGPGVKLEQAYNNVPEFKQLIDENKTYEKLFSMAKKLEGINRHAGTHAAGIVIGHEDLSDIVPLYADPKTKNISTQFEGNYLEEVGLLKMDFLGLKNLSVIQKCLDLLKTQKGLSIAIEKLPLDDPKVYKLLKKGESLGLFQLESSGMQELMRKLSPSCFEDIIALIALYRPGPLNSGMAEEFIQRKKNPSKIKYEHPYLEKILQETYGVIVYQEQVMEIAKTVGGFTMGKADELRKAMGKKLRDKMDSLKELFMTGAEKQNIDLRFAETLYDQMAMFGEYGFNKSHSAAYAMITYQTAYLKSNYPIEYMSALLSCDKDNTDKIVEYISEAKNMDIEILSPSINKSFVDFTVEENKIRFGLSAIKNVGSTAVQSIIQTREDQGEFRSIFDLCEKVDTRVVNKKTLECLIKSGACDDLGHNRASQFNSIDKALDYGQSVKAEKNSGQFSLFGEEEAESYSPVINIEGIEEWGQKDKLDYEKEILGFYFSGHPLEKHHKKIEQLKLNSIASLSDYPEGTEVSTYGLARDVQFKVSKKGAEYGTMVLEGLKGSCDVLFFKDACQKAKPILKEDSIYYVKGKIESLDPKVKLIAFSAIPIEEVNESHVPKSKPKAINKIPQNGFTQKLHIQIKEEIIFQKNFREIEKLKSYFLTHQGQSAIFLHFPPDENTHQEVTIKAGDEFKVLVNSDLMSEIQSFSCVAKAWLF